MGTYTAETAPAYVIRFSPLFCLIMFLSGSVLLWASIMNPPVSPPPSVLAAYKGGDASFQDNMRIAVFSHWFLVSAAVVLAGLSLSALLRQRPLFVIDYRGVTDYGLFFSGFGLVEWGNIESLRRITRLPGHLPPMAWLSVYNRSELIARRSPFLQPFLHLFFYRITVPIIAVDVNWEALRKSIEEYSKHKVRCDSD